MLRHMQKNRFYDQTALAPHYVKKIPTDGFTGKPLKYHLLNGAQSFKLYSVGRNGVNNGGKSKGAGNDDISVRGGTTMAKQ